MDERLGSLLTRLKQEYACARSGIGPLRLTKTQILGLFVRKLAFDLGNSWLDLTAVHRVALLLFAALCVAYTADCISSRRTSLLHRGFPLLQRPKGQRQWDYRAKLEEGARRFPNTPYIIRYGGFEQIVYPSSKFDEIKSLPVSEASLMEYFAHCFFEGWHFLGREIGALHGALAIDLTRSLPARVGERQQLIKTAFSKVVGVCQEWQSTRLYGTVQKLIVMTNTQALLGPELGSNPWWFMCFDLFVYTLMFALFALAPVPHKLRPLVTWMAFGPNWFFYWALKQLARPVVQKDLQAVLENKVPAGQFRLGTWLALRYKPEDRSTDRLAHDFIVTMFESLTTTASTLYLILSELAMRPELAESLREELEAHAVDGQLPMTQLSELGKLDSFMREATRANIFSYLTLLRRTTKPLKLSIGPEVPAGALICVDALNIIQSEARWKDAANLQPRRFLELRQKDGHQNLHQFTSLDSDTGFWGGGQQACPGRFFAGNSIKVFLAHLLLNYDIKLPQAAEKPSVGTMPNGSMMPSLSAKMLIRERRRK